MKVMILGPGRVGCTLALAHQKYGDETTLVGRRPGTWQRWARSAGMKTSLRIPTPKSTDVLLITVGDSDVSTLATQLSQVPTQLLVHVSGSLGLDVFPSSAEVPCAVLHPILSFGSPEGSVEDLTQACVSVAFTRSDHTWKSVLRAWGSAPLLLPAGLHRARYHAALCLASNHVTGALGQAESFLQEAGFSQEDTPPLLASLAHQTVQKFFQDGAANSLTGPLIRGDVPTLQAHLDALPKKKAEAYRQQLKALLPFAISTKRLTAGKIREIRQLLEDS